MTTATVSRPAALERARKAIEAAQIHMATCRARRQGLGCSTCSDVAERAERAARTVAPAADELVIRDGLVSWSRVAA